MQEIANDMTRPRHKGRAAIRLAQIAYRENDLDKCRRYYEQAVAISSDYSVMCASELGLSRITLDEGDVKNARMHLRRSLEYGTASQHFIRRNYYRQRADYVIQAAILMAHAGRLEWATSLLALAFSDAATRNQRDVRLQSELEAALPPHQFAAAWERGQALQWEETIDVLLAELAE